MKWPGGSRGLRADLVLGACALALAIGGFVLIAHLPVGTSSRPGPGAMPRLLLALIAGLGIVILLGELRRPGLRVGLAMPRPVLAIIAGIIAFALLIRPAGLLAAGLAVVLLGGLATDEIGWRARIVSAALLTGATALLFIGALGLPLRLLP